MIKMSFTLGAAAAAVAAIALTPLPATAASTGVMVSGTVIDTGGTVGSGAAVQLIAWPNSAYLASQAVTASVPTILLSTSTTNSSGAFSLSPDLAVLNANYIEPNGAINAELDTITASGTLQSTNLALAAPTASDATDNLDTASSARPAVVDLNLSTSSVSTTVGTDPAVVSPAPTSAGVTTANTATPGVTATITNGTEDDPFCNNWSGVATYTKRSEKFMNLYSYGSATVDEETGSSHKLGIGLSVNDGPWEAHTSETLETHSSSGGDVTYSGNHQLSNLVNEKEYKQTCFIPHTPVTFPRNEIRTIGFNTFLTSSPHIDNRSWTLSDCHLYAKGSFFKTKGSDQTFSGGLSTPFINLSVEASYSADTKVSWTIPSAGEELCGSNSLGFAGAPFGGGEAKPVTGCGTTDVDNTNIMSGDGVTITANNGTADAPSC